MRGAAATSIGKVGTTADGKALIPLLADESADVRNRVLHAIGVLRVREAGPALREMYEQNQRRELGVKVLATLSRMGDPAQAALFRELMQDPDPEKKRLAVEGLGRVSDASRLAGFKKDYQRERNEEVKLAYSFALARWAIAPSSTASCWRSPRARWARAAGATCSRWAPRCSLTCTRTWTTPMRRSGARSATSSRSSGTPMPSRGSPRS